MDTVEPQVSEIGRLRQITRDLIAISALPAAWGSQDSGAVAGSLANVLLATLHLDLVYIRLAGSEGVAPIEAAAGRDKLAGASLLPIVRERLQAFLAEDEDVQEATLAAPFDGGMLRLTLTRFGIGDDHGIVVAGSRRANFPSEHDRLVLGVGANQAAMTVQRQRTERALARSESRFLEFANAAPAMLWVTEPDGACSFLSRGWYDFTGQSESEGLGFGWIDAIHPDDRAAARDAFLRANLGKDEFALEHRLRHADGGYRWVIDTGRPRLSGSGEFLGYAGNVLDITKRKLAEEELAQLTAESERRQRLHETFLANTPDLAYVFDLGHRFTYANPALLAMWGCSWDEAIGKNCLELGYEPWHAAMHDREIEQVKATRQPVRGEVPFNGTAGRRIYDYILVPVLGPDGEVEAIAGTTRDVTERKQAEQGMARMLDREQQRAAILARVAEASKSLNMVLSAQSIGRILAEEARAIVGARAAHTWLRGAGPASGIQADANADAPVALPEARSEDPAAADCTRLFAGVMPEHSPLRLTRAELEGLPGWNGLPTHNGVAVPLTGHGGRNLGFVWLADKFDGEFSDEDEAILLQLAAIAAAGIENARLYEQLRDQDRRKDEFLATLAHELRNPLAPIRTGLTLLRLVPTLGATVKPREIMERQVEHMVRLIDDLLDVSRITSGKVRLSLERIEVRTILNAALELSRPLIEEKRHALSVYTPKESLFLNVDATRMAQVVSNLLNNAAKYTPDGGRIELSVAADGGAAEIRVSDNGVGLAADALPKVFELFTQVGKTLDRSQGGLGIGLALVQRLVEMQGGQVKAESDGPGQGSRFLVRLPLATTTAGAGPTQAPDDSSCRPAPCRILVVDDNVDAADMLAMVLKLSGHAVVTVHNGLDALHSVRNFRPDVIFLDIGLPGMSGYDVARQLRAEPPLARVVLVALTGWGAEEDRQLALEAGFDYHMTKPVDIGRVQALLLQIGAAGGCAPGS
ncbi:PAS domain S-box protein [Massilia sp. DD77]|uniref:PAS domain S-box protein n=1 Tax=Massilia sp. DD77 TaxID=3109349 RepID=UPI002FFE0F64